MAKYSACIEMLFTELAPLERPQAARECGYDAIEIWTWHNWDIAALADSGMPVSLALASSADERTRREFARIGMLTKQSPALFTEMMQESMEALKKLGTGVIVPTPMQAIGGLSREEQEENMIECLRAARPMAEKYGVRIAIEPLNLLVDHAGCYLAESQQAFRIARAGGGHVLFDIYHQQITEGNLISNITSGIDVISHFHAADVPGRHEPGTGEINYANVIKAIDSLGFDGYIGCEFRPTIGTSEASRYILSL